MQRADFLAHVGDPADTLREAQAIEAEAQRRWEPIKGEFFTAAGKPRAKEPSMAAQHEKREIDRVRAQARSLRERASQQQAARCDPWSHIQPHWLRKFGLDVVAVRVEEAHRHYIAQAEAA